MRAGQVRTPPTNEGKEGYPLTITSVTHEAQERILASLEAIADARTRTIHGAKLERQSEEERHTRKLRSISIEHRNANRALVFAIEEAHARGIPKAAIYQRVGLSTQRLSQIRRAIRDEEREAA